MASATVLCYLLLVIVNIAIVTSQEPMSFQDLMFAAKHVPRIGRSANKNGMSEFDKFFMKVSKSVPRIGRRNEGEQVVNTDYRAPILLKYPAWPDISYLYEYKPELFEGSDDFSEVFNPNLKQSIEKYMSTKPDHQQVNDQIFTSK